MAPFHFIIFLVELLSDWLITNLNGFGFGFDTNGNPGYKVGADPVVPFKKAKVLATDKELGWYVAPTVIDCTSVSGYASLTADNFYVSLKRLQYISNPVGWSPVYNVVKSYNATTGMLTVSITVTAQWPCRVFVDVICIG